MRLGQCNLFWDFMLKYSSTVEDSSNFEELAAMNWLYKPLSFYDAVLVNVSSVVCMTVRYCCVPLIIAFKICSFLK